VQADGGVVYLKVIPGSEQEDLYPLDSSRYDRSSELARHLSGARAPIARPIASKQGSTVEVQTFSGVPMVVQVSEALKGSEVSADCRDLCVYERCGIALARFHSAAQSYPRASRFDAGAWEEEWVETQLEIPADDPVLLGEYARIDAWLEASCPLPGGKGLTHGDTNILNFIDNGEEVSLIDIDSPDFTWYANDLAKPFCRADPDLSPEERAELYAGFMTCYRSIRPINVEYEDIRWLMRASILVTYVAYARMPNPGRKDYLKRWYSFVENPDRW
jgi:Ser/Thr protein kinase RdoA (MazF antagonist)